MTSWPNCSIKRLNVEGDERFILDNQHRRADLFGDFASRAVDEIRRLRLPSSRAIWPISVGLKNSTAFKRKAIRGSREIAARFLLAEASSPKVRSIDVVVGGHIAPAAQEQLVESDFRIEFSVETIGVRQNRLERRCDIGVARRPGFRTKRAQTDARKGCAAQSESEIDMSFLQIVRCSKWLAR